MINMPTLSMHRGIWRCGQRDRHPDEKKCTQTRVYFVIRSRAVSCSCTNEAAVRRFLSTLVTIYHIQLHQFYAVYSKYYPSGLQIPSPPIVAWFFFFWYMTQMICTYLC